MHWSIQKLLTQIHTKGRELRPLAKGPADLQKLAIEYDLVPEKWMEYGGWDLTNLCYEAYKVMQIAAEEESPAIDFADMLYLPIKLGLMRPTYDLVVVDEAQDMTVPQLHLGQGLAQGRLVLVGDDKQAIYGFRGADSGSLDRLKSELQATELGLKTTYRCGRSIVSTAQRYVADFMPGAAHEGEVVEIEERDLLGLASPGDFILSRLNAPLVPLALKLYTEQRRCRIQGKDIGAGLKSLIDQITKRYKVTTIEGLVGAITQWEYGQIERAQAAEADHLVQSIQDKAETLRALTDQCPTLEEYRARLTYLFEDEGEDQIILSTVHKAKGLEAPTVFLLKWTLEKFQGPEEENIKYVAITRAKERLVWVTGGSPR
jgi:superfamily I DNA/RNA helicase